MSSNPPFTYIMMDYIVLEEPSSSSTPYVGSSDDGVCGGRALDRHNPIIRDEKRLGHGRFSPSSPVVASTATTTTTPKAAMKGGDKKKKIAISDDDNESLKTNDLISPASSSRCLLSNKPTFDFSLKFHQSPIQSPPHESPPSTPQPPPPPLPFDDLWFLDSDDDDDDSMTFSPPKPPPSPPLEPMDFHNSRVLDTKHHDSFYNPPKPPSPLPPPPPSPLQPSSDQVVVLEVSLHCRGCERKMKKHISKIEGVKSFKIEFAAKKVTVVGNVTPLAVLTSVLKVKNAKLLTPASISPSPSKTCSNGSLQKS